ncbi:hypothetical protein [Enterococcus asini]|uniref:hypothetical protein n=1 Tax=Enterococcus asini TaxID=57732 RepID=UPI003A522A12
MNPRQSQTELTCTIAEEIGHHLTSFGDIIEQDTIEKRKREQKTRDVGALCSLLLTTLSIIFIVATK